MQTIIITGAASGIGQATAKKLASLGWHIGAMDVNEEALTALTTEIGAERCYKVALDISNPEAISSAFAEYVAHTGHLDALFNCAGVLEVGDFASISPAKHQRIIDVNMAGVLHGTHAAFDYLRQRDHARVVNMCSASAIYGVPGFASYSASKFFVRGLTEALNIEWQEHGIYVCDIAPPFVNTPMLTDTNSPLIEKLGVSLSADDIASVVLKALTGKRVHYWVSTQLKMLQLLSKWLPSRWARASLKRLAKR